MSKKETVKCKECGSECFITLVENINYHVIIEDKEYEEYNAKEVNTDVESKTYCASCKTDFDYSVNI